MDNITILPKNQRPNYCTYWLTSTTDFNTLTSSLTNNDIWETTPEN